MFVGQLIDDALVIFFPARHHRCGGEPAKVIHDSAGWAGKVGEDLRTSGQTANSNSGLVSAAPPVHLWVRSLWGRLDPMNKQKKTGDGLSPVMLYRK